MDAPGFISVKPFGHTKESKSDTVCSRTNTARILAHLLASERHLNTLQARVLREEVAPWAT